jgi:hypothetical protein
VGFEHPDAADEHVGEPEDQGEGDQGRPERTAFGAAVAAAVGERRGDRLPGPAGGRRD